MSVINFGKPTAKMIEYMEILFNDCGFTRVQRNAWLRELVGRDVHYLDSLTKNEAHLIIAKLKLMKEELNG